MKALALTGIALCLLPMTAIAAPTKMMPKMASKKMTHAAMYQCQKCHMKYTAAQAKKDHYKDPMDGGKLVPVKAAAKPTSMKPAKMSMPKGAISM